MKKIGVGIIGFGLSGKVFHAPLLKTNENYVVKKVMTSRKQEVEGLLSQTQVVASVEEILTDPEIDLVINCAPNQYHYQYSADALMAGKHVVVEKPFVNSMEQGNDLINLAKKQGRYLSVFHNRRWDADFLTIKNLIESDQLGDIKQFESHFDRFRPHVRPEKWREQTGEGSGTFYDLGAHLIDQALVLFGWPDSIYADIAAQRDANSADDYFHVILKYATTRVILHSTSFGKSSPRFEILGSQASYVKHGMDPQEQALKEGALPGQLNFGKEDEINYGKILTYPEDQIQSEVHPSMVGQYQKYYDELYYALIGERTTLPVSAQEALDVIALIQWGYQSSREKKEILLPRK